MKHDSIRSYKENGSIFRRESPRYQSLHEGICLRKNNRRGRNLNPELQKLVEVTAVVHDIACPLCRVKYGNTNGKHQEEESAALLEEFFKDSDLPKEFTDRVSYIVSHHHTIDGIDGIDYQIMIEADYLVNADESNFSGNNVRNMLEKVFKTETGKFLLKSMYQKRLDSAEEK